MGKANLYKVKVVPKPLKSIVGILPDQKCIEGEPIELELTKDEICRCMKYADVYDMSSGEESHICECSFKEIVEYEEELVEDNEDTGSEDNTESGDGENTGSEGTVTGPTGSGEQMEEEEEGEF